MYKEKLDGLMIKPCIGCGYCCLKAPCTVGVTRFNLTKMTERCPGLLWSNEDKRYWCQIYRFIPTIDCGCSSTLSGWRTNVKERGDLSEQES